MGKGTRRANQFVGRNPVQRSGSSVDCTHPPRLDPEPAPGLLRHFDQLRFFPVESEGGSDGVRRATGGRGKCSIVPRQTASTPGPAVGIASRFAVNRAGGWGRLPTVHRTRQCRRDSRIVPERRHSRGELRRGTGHAGRAAGRLRSPRGGRVSGARPNAGEAHEAPRAQ